MEDLSIIVHLILLVENLANSAEYFRIDCQWMDAILHWHLNICLNPARTLLCECLSRWEYTGWDLFKWFHNRLISRTFLNF